MRKLRVTGALIALISLTACASGSNLDPNAAFRTEPAAVASVSGVQLREYQLDLSQQLTKPDCSPKSVAMPPGTDTSAAQVAAQKELTRLVRCTEEEPDLAVRKALRNELVSDLIMASNANCNVYLLGLRGGQVTARMTTDTVSTTSGIIGALVKPAGTIRAFSAISALSTALGASVDRNIFAMQSAELAADAIKHLREDDRTVLDQKKTRDYDDWPIGEAVADVLDYHSDCSMLRGLTRMHDALTTREAAVSATRQALLALAENNVQGAPLEKVIQSLDGAVSEPAPAITQNPNGQLELQLASARDLATLKDKVHDCVDAFRNNISTTLNTTDQVKAKLDKSCQPAAVDWWGRVLNDAFAKFDSTTINAIAAGAAAAADDTAKKQGAAAGDAAVGAANDAAGQDLAAISAARTGAARGISDLAKANGSAQAVVDLLHGYRNPPEEADPMLAGMASAAAGSVADAHKMDPGSGAIAAANARATAADYAARCDYTNTCKPAA